MGSLRGHIGPGLAFTIIGLWHLFNHTKLHIQNPNSYISHTWFPISNHKHKHLELHFIIAAAAASISMELFILPRRHHPFAPDGSIPSNHLHNLEHAAIALAFLAYAASALALDRLSPPAKSALTRLLAAAALAQELLLFRLHSADHAGLEGRYHWLLQLLVAAALAASAADPRNFVLGFVRSLAIFAQGVWLIVIGVMLYTPRLMPRGCAVGVDDGHYVVRCGGGGGGGGEAADRAKALATILFCYFVVGVWVFGVGVYLCLVRLYSKDKGVYHSLGATDSEAETGLVVE